MTAEMRLCVALSASMGDMEIPNLGQWPLSDLLALRSGIDQESAGRGHVRTSSSLSGELIEQTVSVAYTGRLAPVGTKSVDVIAGDGRGIQVKMRSLPKGDLRHWAFKDFEFDAAVVVAVDRATGLIDWARELSRSEAEAIAKPHSQGWRIRMAAAQTAGLDVTGKLRTAFTELA